MVYAVYNLKNNIKNMSKLLPYYAEGEIIKGFGRGSKELGIPTANFPKEVVENLQLDTGVYYGFAQVIGEGVTSDIHKMVLSVGWNPFYNNTEKSMETHILHNFGRDLYGCLLKVCLVGYLRPEKNFDSLEALVGAINIDIKQAKELLDLESNSFYKNSNFFKALSSK